MACTQIGSGKTDAFYFPIICGFSNEPSLGAGRGGSGNVVPCPLEHVLTLVFVEMKKGANELEHWVSRGGFLAIAMHDDKLQKEREQTLRSFKCGATPILVATDVVSRGIDIPHVAHGY
ncbi:hypothetical protein GQ457_18G011880 [Hibiscus cannabinus]